MPYHMYNQYSGYKEAFHRILSFAVCTHHRLSLPVILSRGMRALVPTVKHANRRRQMLDMCLQSLLLLSLRADLELHLRLRLTYSLT